MFEKLILVLFVVSQCGAETERELWLLPGDVRPLHYNLTFFTHIERFDEADESSFNFDGDVLITLEVNNLGGDINVDKIILHRDVTIVFEDVKLFGFGDPFVVNVGSYDAVTNKQTLDISPPIVPGNLYLLQIQYKGSNIEDTLGFYRSSYINSAGEKRWLVTTHFESAGARRAFPCFDEPRFKATYTIALIYSKELAAQGYHGLSNAEIEYVLDGEALVWAQFEETPYPLSTYLVAFILSDFTANEIPASFNSSFDGEPANKLFRTWAQSESIDEGLDYISQRFGPAILELYTKLFRRGFAFNKVDQAAIPDFRIGAMENWGMVTYRDIYLLPPINTSASLYMQAARVVCHELSHQWFGDLVTLHWWSDIWLNEAFADFFEYFGTDQLRFPDEDVSTWNLHGQFVTAEIQARAFVTDANSNSHALTAEVWSPEDVDANFDNISYSKGGSILRMWKQCVGEPIYYKALQSYLESGKFDLGHPEGLIYFFYAAIESTPIPEQPELPASVIDIFSDWHLIPGYPVLNVTLEEGVLVITQERFLSGSVRPSPTPSPWYIPLTYFSDKEQRSNDTTPVQYFIKGENVSKLELKNNDIEWFVVNNQETGFYRVNYDSANWQALFKVLNDSNTFELINEINRGQIIDDSTNLGVVPHTQYVPISTALNILTYLRHENSFVPWRSASLAIRRILRIFETDSNLREEFIRFAVYLTNAGLKNARNKSSDSIVDKLLVEELQELLIFLTTGYPREESRFTFFEDRSTVPKKHTRTSQDLESDEQWLHAHQEEVLQWLGVYSKNNY